MAFGKKIQDLREEKKLSQQELGRQVGTSGSIIGRYEREEMTPGIDVVKKISEALGVSIDFLVDNENKFTSFRDRNILERMADIERLTVDDKNHLYFLIDAVIRDSKTRKAYSK